MKNKEANAPAKPELPEEFRAELVDSIINDELLATLDDDRKELLLRELSYVYNVLDIQQDQARIRTLKKVSTDARRLKSALNMLTPEKSQHNELTHKDYKTLSLRYKDQATLSNTKIFLDELANDATKLAEIIKGEHKKIKDLQEKLKAGHLIKILRKFDIPYDLRHDYPTDKKATSKYPRLGGATTLAMRCVLLAMLDGQHNQLSWSRVITVTKRGITYYESIMQDQNKIFGQVTLDENEVLKLFMLKDPNWNAMKL